MADQYDDLFEELYGDLEKRKKDKEEGRVNSILWPFKRLSSKFPGWERGRYNIFTANSGIGKTKLTKYLILNSIYEFCQTHPEIKPKVFYFALEESSKEFYYSLMSTMLYEKYKINLSVAQLRSSGDFTLSDDQLIKVRECKEHITKIMRYVEVIDHIHNGFGIYKYVRSYAEKNGEYIKEKREIKDGDNTKIQEFNIGYTPNDPNEYVFVVTDHISLLSPEGQMNLYESIGYFSKEYCLQGFVKRFNYIVVQVQQQAADQEKKEFFKGQTIESKLEPSLDGLGENKSTQREADLVIGLFAPVRYGLSTHRGYNITRFEDTYRSIIFLKDRHHGLANQYLATYFNGASNTFVELPPAEDFEKNQELYKQFGV